LLRDEQNRFADTVRHFKTLSANMLNHTAASLEGHATYLIRCARVPIASGKERQQEAMRMLSRSVQVLCTRQYQVLSGYTDAIRKDALTRIREGRLRTEHLERAVAALDPVNVLKRGFSITRRNGKSLHNAAD